MRFFSSTKVRLTFWYVGVLAVILIAFASATYYWFDNVLRSETDKTLSEIAASFENFTNRELQEIESEGRTPPGEKQLSEAINDSTVEVSFRNYKIFVFSADGQLVSAVKAQEPATPDLAEYARKWFRTFTGNNEANQDRYGTEGKKYRVHFHPFLLRGNKFFLIVIHPLGENESLLEQVSFAFLITVPLSLLLASIGGYLLMRKSFAPIAEMGRKAEDITARSLHERLPAENEEDELGRLAATFNRLLARLDLSFEQQQRFMADASHELRTPVAIVRGEAEVSLTKKDRSPEEYRETISLMGREGERMSRLIEDLLTLARADSGEESAAKESVYIEDVISATVRSFRSLAEKRGVGLSVGELPEMPFIANEPLLRRLFVNLVDNASKFARTSVTIDAVKKDGEYVISIADDGAGIPIESRDKIFERFYRVDRARSRQQTTAGSGSGAGLGLSIARWIGEDQGGSVELAATGESGTVFTVIFPAPEDRSP